MNIKEMQMLTYCLYKINPEYKMVFTMETPSKSNPIDHKLLTAEFLTESELEQLNKITPEYTTSGYISSVSYLENRAWWQLNDRIKKSDISSDNFNQLIDEITSIYKRQTENQIWDSYNTIPTDISNINLLESNIKLQFIDIDSENTVFTPISVLQVED